MASKSSKSNQPGDRDVVLGSNNIGNEQDSNYARNLSSDSLNNSLNNSPPTNAAILGGETPLRRWNLSLQTQPDQFDRDRELSAWQQERDRHQSENFQQMELSHANLRGSYFRQDNLRMVCN
jgi:hypothetical protein